MFHILRHWTADVTADVNINPINPGYGKSCDTVQQKWEQAGSAPQNHNQHVQTQELVSPIKSFSNTLNTTTKPSKQA